MSDDLGLFDEQGEPAGRPQGRRAARRAALARARRKRRRRLVVVLSTLAVIALVAYAGWYGVREFVQLRSVPDYAGGGETDVVIRVEQGDTTSAIAERLAERDVVASARAFTRAAAEESEIRSVQPGYYQMRTKISGADAVTRLLADDSRVGQLEVRSGQQLHDVVLPDGTVHQGVLSAISEATCAELNGRSTCIPVETLVQTAAETEPGVLGVPTWAREPVAAVEPRRRMEGLIAPGRYDIRPGASALEVWQQVMSRSSALLQAAGLPGNAAGSGFTPYEVLVTASIIQKEGIPSDFGRVSRVIHNRLAQNWQLQMDSTINYPLDRPEIRTTPEDRARPGPYNTYVNYGLPISPIGVPSAEAIAAAVNPVPGDWMFFVRCETDGQSCFSVTREQHNAARESALARGIY